MQFPTNVKSPLHTRDLFPFFLPFYFLFKGILQFFKRRLFGKIHEFVMGKKGSLCTLFLFIILRFDGDTSCDVTGNLFFSFKFCCGGKIQISISVYGIKSNRDKVANGSWLLMSDQKELLNSFELKKIEVGVAYNGRLFATLHSSHSIS